MGQRAGEAGGQPGTAAGWQGVPLGHHPRFCKEILGPGFNPRGSRCGYPSRGASTQMSLQGRDAGWDMFLPVVVLFFFLKAGQPSHLTRCLLPSICLHSRNLSIPFFFFLFPLFPTPTEMLASREKRRSGGK